MKRTLKNHNTLRSNIAYMVRKHINESVMVDELEEAKQELQELLDKLRKNESYMWFEEEPFILESCYSDVADNDIDENLEVYSINREGEIETQFGIIHYNDITNVDDIGLIIEEIGYVLEEKELDLARMIDEINDDEDVVTFEKMKSRRRLEEKLRRCCPKSSKRVNEQLTAYHSKDQKKLDKIEADIQTVLDDINSNYITPNKAAEALAKLKAENKKLSKINKDENIKFTLKDVKGYKKAVDKIAQINPTKREEIDKLDELIKKVNENVKLDKKTSVLHEGVTVNNKSLAEFSINEMRALKQRLIKFISKQTLNESSLSNSEKHKINSYNKLISFLNEEINYRILYARKYAQLLKESKKLNENLEEVTNANPIIEAEDGSFTDDELKKMFGSSLTEETAKEENKEEKTTSKEKTDTADDAETTSDEAKTNDEDSENQEETEEVELTRIVITLVNREAAESLKDVCIEAEIPEDVIEIEEVEEDQPEDEETEDTSDEDAEQSEETQEEESDGETNESYNYNNIRSLFEDVDDEESDNVEQDSEGTDESADDEADDDDAAEEQPVKFILTDTDYAIALANVLEKVYGISKEEFEEMIGGSMVEEEAEDDEPATEEDEESTTEDPNAEINTEDLFKGL